VRRAGLLILPLAIALFAGCSDEEDDGNRPDPAVRSITVDPLQPEAGAQFKLKVHIENLNDVYAPRVTWRLRQDGVTQATAFLTGLEGRENMTLDVTVNANSGTFTYAFQLNWDGSLEEADEGNNTALVTVTVQPFGKG
jgi:hypothetical protein